MRILIPFVELVGKLGILYTYIAVNQQMRSNGHVTGEDHPGLIFHVINFYFDALK